jgi:hypothetical protein
MRSSLCGSFRHTHLFSRSPLFLSVLSVTCLGVAAPSFFFCFHLLSFVVKTFNTSSNNACLGLRLFGCLLWGFQADCLFVCCGDLGGAFLQSTGSSCKVLFPKNPSSVDPLKLQLQCVSCG